MQGSLLIPEWGLSTRYLHRDTLRQFDISGMLSSLENFQRNSMDYQISIKSNKTMKIIINSYATYINSQICLQERAFDSQWGGGSLDVELLRVSFSADHSRTRF